MALTAYPRASGVSRVAYPIVQIPSDTPIYVTGIALVAAPISGAVSMTAYPIVDEDTIETLEAPVASGIALVEVPEASGTKIRTSNL
jgi:hypothetical protein